MSLACEIALSNIQYSIKVKKDIMKTARNVSIRYAPFLT